MFFTNKTERKILVSAALAVATLLVVSVTVLQYSKAQTSQTGQSGLKFFIKYSKSANATSPQGTSASPSAGNTTSASATKKITVNVNLQRGSGGAPIKLPITATVPSSAKTEDLQLCASLPGGSQSCQPLSAKGANIDLTKQSQGTTAANNTGATTSATTGSPSTPVSPKAYNNNGDEKTTRAVFTTSPESILDMNLYPVDALIGITNTSLFVPVTVIVPVNVQIQNAQVCASVLSGGSQSCQQLVLNPTQTTFSPISVNLSNPTPTFASTPPSTTTTTTSAPNPLSSITNGLTQPPTSSPSSPSTSSPSTSSPSTPPPSTSSPSSPSTSSPSTGSGSSSSGSTSGSTK
jgi:hypothetical protein